MLRIWLTCSLACAVLLLAAPVDAQYACDTFTNITGTNLQDHSPTCGGVWNKHSSSSGGDQGDTIIDGGRARAEGTNGLSYYFTSLDADSPDYDVEVDVVAMSTDVAGTPGVWGRLDDSVITGYTLVYEHFDAVRRWAIAFCISDVCDYIGDSGGGSCDGGATFDQTLTDTQSYRIKLEMRGTAIKGYVDDVLRFDCTDSQITARGSAGISAHSEGVSTSATTGYHLDNFEASNPAGAPASSCCGGPLRGIVGGGL